MTTLLDGVNAAPGVRRAAATSAGTAHIDLGSMLENRRWRYRASPFPHVVARDVFSGTVASAITDAFRRVITDQSSVHYAPKHDFFGGPLTGAAPEPLHVFLAPEWHLVFARIFGVTLVPQVSAGLHRHRPGSRNGFPHNDIKPEVYTPTTGPPIQTIRGLSILYYLGNGPSRPTDGGGTGLYRHWSDPVTQPERVVPPIDNSLLAFPCSPFSYHSFLANSRQRDSIIVFLYRRLDQFVAEWGPEGLSQYADG